jgi:predicted site-specific integrase-resolvase
MKLSDWAKDNGLSYITVYRWWKQGILPVKSEQIKETGTIIVYPIKPNGNGVALYARVSSGDQKSDLDRQLSRLVEYASHQNLVVVKSVSEIGSGLNGHRHKLLELLRDNMISGIVVEHRDRLARFGSDYIESAMSSSGRKLYVIDETEMKDDLVKDMIDVLTSFCARLYGRRSAKNRAIKAVEATKDVS